MDLTDRFFQFITRFNKPVSTHTFSAFRIFFSIHILIIIANFYQLHPLVFDSVPDIGRNSFPAKLFIVLWTIAVGMLLVGFYTRIAAILNYVFVVLATILFINASVGSFNDDLLRIGSLLCIFMPVSRSFSCDALIDKLTNIIPRKPQTQQLNYILFLFLSLGLMYTASAFTKLVSPMWLKGLGLWIPLNIPHNKWNALPNLIINQEGLMMVVNYLVIIWELVFLFLLFKPRYHGWIIVPGILFHLGIAVFFPFPLICTGPLAFYLLFLNDQFWNAISKRLKSRVQSELIYSRSDIGSIRLARLMLAFDFRERYAVKWIDGRAQESSFNTTCNALHAYWLYRPLLFIIQLKPVRLILRSVFRLYFSGAWVQSGNGLLNYAFHKTLLVYFTLFCLTMQLGVSTYHVYHRIKHRVFNEDNRKAHDMHGNFDISTKPGMLVRIFLGINGRGLFLDHDSKGLKTTYALTRFDDKGNEYWMPMMSERGYVGSDLNMNLVWAKTTFQLIAFGTQPADSIGLKKLTRFWALKQKTPLDSLHFKVYKKTYTYPTAFEKDYYLKLESLPWLEEGEIWWQNGKFSYQSAQIGTKH
ncbi:MAG: HTTM domain-containing protein [Bacteroidia bacterium]|jgi:uncharacterized membrane protein YphA (DoxX/SURF4 family)